MDPSQEDLIKSHLPLVRKIVDRVMLNIPEHIDTGDLYSVGVTGLFSAARRFDPKGSLAFESYAAARIRGAILDELRRLDWRPQRKHKKPAVARMSIDLFGEDARESVEAKLHSIFFSGTNSASRDDAKKHKVLAQLAQRITQLPDMQRKIVAMYYFENMRLAEIADVFGLTESRICQIHSQTILELGAFLNKDRSG